MSYRIPCSYLALISAPFFFLIGDAWPNQAIWSVHSHSKARLILANNEVSESGNLHFGVHITLEKNWKTYWRNPGNSGVPPEFDWSGSENIEQIRLFWPAPKRITTGPSDFYGSARKTMDTKAYKAQSISQYVHLGIVSNKA